MEKYYIAYDGNLSIARMMVLCPEAEIYDIGTLQDYKLVFCGEDEKAFASLIKRSGYAVPVLVWKVDEYDIAILSEHYEERNLLYRKEEMNVIIDGTVIKGFTFISAIQQTGLPDISHMSDILDGYEDCDFNPEPIEIALNEKGGDING